MDLDIKPVITEIRIYADGQGHDAIPREYPSDVVYGAGVKAMAVALYSEGVMSNDRIAAFLNAVSGDGLDLSEGSVYHFCKNFSERSENSIAHLEEELLNQPVVATDATVITVNGEQEYIRNFSTTKSVLYRAMQDKKLDTMHRVHFRFIKNYRRQTMAKEMLHTLIDMVPESDSDLLYHILLKFIPSDVPTED